MASTVGLGFLWAAVVSVTIQYFLNMEIERYTLATGETAVPGFVRFWKPWGVAVLPLHDPPEHVAGMGDERRHGPDVPHGRRQRHLHHDRRPRRVGPSRSPISPVVYQTLERAQFFKVGADARLSRGRDRRRDRAVGVGRLPLDDHASSASSRTRASCRSPSS